MTLAERTRESAREHPFILDALRAGVLNYSAAARFLDIGDDETVAAALRRYGEELTEQPRESDVRVTMETGVGERSGGTGEDGLLTIGECTFVPGDGSLTAILVTGSVSVRLFRRALGRCDAADLSLRGAGVSEDSFLIVVERREGPNALQFVESVCEQ